jgi:hypothetical protein
MSQHLAFLFAAGATAFAAVPPSVPFTLVQITGTQNDQSSSTTGTYRAYQASPADGFRLLCQEPCSLDPSLIYAKYAGMKIARQSLLALVGGVDHTPKGAPFDYHVQGDSFCGAYQPGYTGDAGFYATGGSFGCFWDVEKQNPTYPFTVENAQRIESQLLFVHEYGHTLFYDRHHASYEDAVKAFSIYVCGIDATPPGQADFCDPGIGIYMPLFHDLCQRNGFQPADFAPAMRELDRIFQAGMGTMYAGSGGKPVTSIRVFRRLLDSLLGSDTRGAFLAAGYTPFQAGGDAVAPAAGGTVSIAGGAVTLSVPAGALAANTTLLVENAYGSPNIANLSFQQMFRLLPDGITFSKPVRVTVSYHPSALEPAGANETHLRLWTIHGSYPSGPWVIVPNQQVDAKAHTISGDITATGQFGFFIQ